jgi:hypothetical protein
MRVRVQSLSWQIKWLYERHSVSAAAKCFVAVSQFSVSHLDLLPLREPGPGVALDADQGPTHTYSESYYVKKQETRFFNFFLLSSSRACLGKENHC